MAGHEYGFVLVEYVLEGGGGIDGVEMILILEDAEVFLLEYEGEEGGDGDRVICVHKWLSS
ncbi:hypothetical protein [Bacillus sp. WP8]|uniref:hypothetical protein n=1 Tax=Bacillus sp. WP8 TaxID=756828 RepID=UPI0011A512F2|nr:hypothetical protein [Bacillus sp. WP8]